MTAGIFIGGKRPTSKKQIKEAIAAGPLSIERISVECTSMFGGFYGTLAGMEVGQKVTFVGPDPYTKRTFYGVIERTPKGYKVS